MRAGSSDPILLRLLAAHPAVEGPLATDDPGIVFARSRERRVSTVHAPSPEAWFGLVELADNNPLVCADLARVPSPAQTLALIALGPLLKTGLILEPPALVADVPLDEGALLAALRIEGPLDGLTTMELDPAHPTVRRAQATVAVADPGVHGLGDADAFDEAYEEPYARVLYVRRDEDSVWSAELVANRPWAVYRLGITEGDGGVAPHRLGHGGPARQARGVPGDPPHECHGRSGGVARDSR